MKAAGMCRAVAARVARLVLMHHDGACAGAALAASIRLANRKIITYLGAAHVFLVAKTSTNAHRLNM